MGRPLGPAFSVVHTRPHSRRTCAGTLSPALWRRRLGKGARARPWRCVGRVRRAGTAACARACGRARGRECVRVVGRARAEARNRECARRGRPPRVARGRECVSREAKTAVGGRGARERGQSQNFGRERAPHSRALSAERTRAPGGPRVAAGAAPASLSFFSFCPLGVGVTSRESDVASAKRCRFRVYISRKRCRLRAQATSLRSATSALIFDVQSKCLCYFCVYKITSLARASDVASR